MSNLLAPLVIIVILTVGAVIYFKTTPSNTSLTSQNTPSPMSQPTTTASGGVEQTKTFKSESLKFSIEISNKSRVNSSNTSVEVINQDGASINIVRNGTGFEELDDYLNNFDSRRSIIVKTSNDINIDGYIAKNRVEERIVGGKKEINKVYYIWIEPAVYILSTSSEELYDDLDQIAQSFRYIP